VILPRCRSFAWIIIINIINVIIIIIVNINQIFLIFGRANVAHNTSKMIFKALCALKNDAGKARMILFSAISFYKVFPKKTTFLLFKKHFWAR
jgi:hypothetical protein